MLGSISYAQDAAQIKYKSAMDNLLAGGEINSAADLGKTSIKQAMSLFKQIMGEFPNTRWAEMSENQIAWAYYKGKNYNGAALEFRSLITNFPASMLSDDWRFMTGKIAYDLGNFEDAIIIFQGVIGAYSLDANLNLRNRVDESYIMKAKCRLKQKKYREAEVEFNNFIQ